MKHGTHKRKTGPRMVGFIENMARSVMRALGPGHSERVYHRAMITSLNKAKTPHRSEVLSPIYFMGETVGVARCDLVVRGFAVEIKANTRHPRKALPQLRKYIWSLSKTEKRPYAGIIINFNQKTRAVQAWHVPAINAKTDSV